MELKMGLVNNILERSYDRYKTIKSTHIARRWLSLYYGIKIDEKSLKRRLKNIRLIF